MGFPEKTTMKADRKLTIVMCCHIFDRRSVTPSTAGDRRRQGCHGVTKVQMCDDVELHILCDRKLECHSFWAFLRQTGL